MLILGIIGSFGSSDTTYGQSETRSMDAPGPSVRLARSTAQVLGHRNVLTSTTLYVAQLPSSRSKVRSTGTVIFDHESIGSNVPSTTSSDTIQYLDLNDFALIPMEVRGDHREFKIGEQNCYGSFSDLEREALSFLVIRIAPDHFRITTEDLPPGEYAFIAHRLSPFGRQELSVFDFGID